MSNGSQRVTGKDKRGSSYSRRARREWLWKKGKGDVYGFISCYHCEAILRFDTFQVDRFPVCGHDGGRYTRDNIVAACKYCNSTRCQSCSTLSD